MSKPELTEKFMIDEGLEDAGRPTEEFITVDSGAVLRIAEVVRGVDEGTITYDKERVGKEDALLLPIWEEGSTWQVEPPEAEQFYSDPSHEWVEGEDGGPSNMLENRGAIAAYDLDGVDALEVGVRDRGEVVRITRDGHNRDAWHVTHEEGMPGYAYYKRLFSAIGSGAIFEPGFGRKIQYPDSDSSIE